MPAERHRFSEGEPPELLFFDTSFVLSVVLTHEAHNEACHAFLGRLRIAGAAVVVSPVLLLEYFNGWRRAMAQGLIGSSQGVDANERGRLFSIASDLLREALANFRVREVRLTDALQERMLQLMTEYNLQSLDAVNIASALEIGCADVVSLDDDFRRVDGIRLWTP